MGRKARLALIATAALHMLLHDVPGIAVELTLRDRAKWVGYADVKEGLDADAG